MAKANSTDAAKIAQLNRRIMELRQENEMLRSLLPDGLAYDMIKRLALNSLDAVSKISHLLEDPEGHTEQLVSLIAWVERARDARDD